MIYLDNNASTALDPEVCAAMAEAAGLFGNPSSIHAEGRRARQAVEESRDRVARLLGARPEEIFFTSGGTEANAIAIFGSASGRKGRILRSGAEHPSVREAFAALASRGSAVEDIVDPEPSGALDAARVASRIGPDTRLVSVMLANNEYGGIFPVAEIARRAKDVEAAGVVHADAVQACGRIPVDVTDLGVDLLSVSGHKMHGPKGAGALFVRRGTRLEPHTPGGGQERRLRAGTENTAGIVGLGVAARLAGERLSADAAAVSARRDRLESAILSRTPGARVIGAAAPRLPNTSAILFEEVPGVALAIRLDLEGVAVSTGSACSSGSLKPSPAILSLGLSASDAKRVIRVSLSRETTDGEVEAAAERISSAVADMRRVPELAATS